MIWIGLCVTSLIFFLVSMFLMWAKTVKSKRIVETDDDKVVGLAVGKWEPIVVFGGMTFRGVKMFANRARIVCSRASSIDAQNSRPEYLVGIAALVDFGILGHGTDLHEGAEFEQANTYWRNELRNLLHDRIYDDKAKDEIDHFLRFVEFADWSIFVQCSEGIRFASYREENFKPHFSGNRSGDVGDASSQVKGMADFVGIVRKWLGLSHDEFGKLVGVSGQVIVNWEGGKTAPRGRYLSALRTVEKMSRLEAIKRLRKLNSRA